MRTDMPVIALPSSGLFADSRSVETRRPAFSRGAGTRSDALVIERVDTEVKPN